eukprot:1933651-Rhodomonas_salina.1
MPVPDARSIGYLSTAHRQPSVSQYRTKADQRCQCRASLTTRGHCILKRKQPYSWTIGGSLLRPGESSPLLLAMI